MANICSAQNFIWNWGEGYFAHESNIQDSNPLYFYQFVREQISFVLGITVHSQIRNCENLHSLLINIIIVLI